MSNLRWIVRDGKEELMESYCDETRNNAHSSLGDCHLRPIERIVIPEKKSLATPMTEPMRENERIATRIAAMCGMKETTFGELSDSIKEALDSKDSLIQAKEKLYQTAEGRIADQVSEIVGLVKKNEALEERIKLLEWAAKVNSDEGKQYEEYLKAEIASLRTLVKELGLALAGKCVTPIVIETTYVSRDMAIDAGDLELEGSIYEQGRWEPCGTCHVCQALLLIPEELRKDGA